MQREESAAAAARWDGLVEAAGEEASGAEEAAGAVGGGDAMGAQHGRPPKPRKRIDLAERERKEQRLAHNYH